MVQSQMPVGFYGIGPLVPEFEVGKTGVADQAAESLCTGNRNYFDRQYLAQMADIASLMIRHPLKMQQRNRTFRQGCDQVERLRCIDPVTFISFAVPVNQGMLDGGRCKLDSGRKINIQCIASSPCWSFQYQRSQDFARHISAG